VKAAEATRTADTERMKAEHAEALDKLRTELQSSVSVKPEEAATHSAEELQQLEERLKKQHEEELKKAVEAATAAASVKVESPVDRKAIEEAAAAAKEAELKVKHEEELAAAVERGRMEASAKTKIKDGQLVRAQTKVKELEALLQEARKAGFVPPQPAAGPSTAPASSPATVKPTTVATPTAPAAKPGPSKPTAPAGAPTAPRPAPAAARPPGAAALPARPGQPQAAQAAGRGRGVPVRGRGGISIRGAAPASAVASPTASPSTTEPAGISIAGAAAKRTREEGDAGDGENTLAKRLKPEAAAKPARMTRSTTSSS
jgi:nucleoprotein TPR